jgi:hypothetical protein
MVSPSQPSPAVIQRMSISEMCAEFDGEFMTIANHTGCSQAMLYSFVFLAISLAPSEGVP